MNAPTFTNNRETLLDTKEDLNSYLELVKSLFQQAIDEGIFSWTGAYMNLSFDIKHIFDTFKKHNKSEDWLRDELR